MKKLFVFVFGLLAALAICGCQVKEEGELAPEGKVFTATMEAFVDDASGVDTKTSLDAGGSVLWKMGDQVSIFAGSTINEHYQVTDASDGRTSAALNRVESPGFVAGGDIDNNVAYYPYSETAELAKNGSAYVIRDIALPATQTYAQASFGNGAFPMTAVTSSTRDYNLKFKNVLGGLKLQLKGTATIASISITGNNNEVLCGDAVVDVSTTTAPSISLNDASVKTVTLDCGNGVQLNETTATAFIIALPPITMAVGFTVTVTDTENKQMEITTTKSQAITRSNLLSMPAVTYEGTGSDPISEPVAVDLGLPSGLKWASCNVGATAPEDYGDYFAWGETEPYYSDQDPLTWKDGKKAGYFWTSYKFELGTDVSGPFSKYVTDSYFGTVDNKTVLDPEDDAVIVNWGGTWRMPTDSEWTELRNECSWTWTTLNGVNGYRVISSTNSNSIFLPAAGLWSYKRLGSAEVHGIYWSASLHTGDPYCAWVVSFSSANVNHSEAERCLGYSVRPVSVRVTGVLLNKSFLRLVEGGTTSLIATVTPSNALQSNVVWSSSDNSVAIVDDNGKVTAVSVGTVTITATTYDGGFTASCNVTVSGLPSGTINGYEWVDLGLTSGLKWATCNVGASAPEEYGDYFAWGEIEPYYISQAPLTWKDGKTGYDWVSYKFRTSGDSWDSLIFNKYNYNSNYGSVDNKSVLDPEDDAAYVNWGNSWRMPTQEEWWELLRECTLTRTTINGIYGLQITSNTSDNSIFLPFAGNRRRTLLYNVGSRGDYWSSSLSSFYPYEAQSVAFASDFSKAESDYRCYGQSVRPVTE